MTELPPELDGADLLCFAVAPNDSDFGFVQELDTPQDIAITALAICRYPGQPEQVCLFACDANRNIRGDLLYDSIEEAKTEAERYYQTGPLSWQSLQRPAQWSGN